VFFVMAGFFGALLYERRGAIGFLRNRAARILAPLVLILPPLFSLLFGMLIYQKYATGPDRLQQAVMAILTGRQWEWFETTHLWFLYYLMMLSGLAYVAMPAVRRVVQRTWCQAMHRKLRGAIGSFWAPMIFVPFTFATLLLTKLAVVEAPNGVMPDPVALVNYAVFYGFGWWFWSVRDRLQALTLRPIAMLLTSLLLMFASFVPAVVLLTNIESIPAWSFYSLAFGGSLVVWYAIFGFTGLFERYLQQPAAWARYLSDSSYRVYIAHSPAIFLMQIWLSGVVINPWLKTLLVILGALPMLYVSYHFLVRPTWMGAFLNGRRYPIRALPWRKEQQEKQPSQELAPSEGNAS
jgi:hypothetical protein